MDELLEHHYAMQGDIEAARALLGAGADPTAADEHGRAASDLAEERGFHSLAAELSEGSRQPSWPRRSIRPVVIRGIRRRLEKCLHI